MAVIKFEVNDGRGNGTGCFGMQVRADAAKFTQRYEIWSEKVRCLSKMKPRLRAEWVVFV